MHLCLAELDRLNVKLESSGQGRIDGVFGSQRLVAYDEGDINYKGLQSSKGGFETAAGVSPLGARRCGGELDFDDKGLQDSYGEDGLQLSAVEVQKKQLWYEHEIGDYSEEGHNKEDLDPKIAAEAEKPSRLWH